MQAKKQWLEPDMEQLTGYKLGKEYVKAVYCHPVYLTYMQSTSIWTAELNEAQAGIKFAGRMIDNLRYADDTTLNGRKWRGTKSILMKAKLDSEKADIPLNIHKTKIMASGPIISWQIDGETVETVSDFNFLGLQNHCRWWLQAWD